MEVALAGGWVVLACRSDLPCSHPPWLAATPASQASYIFESETCHTTWSAASSLGCVNLSMPGHVAVAFAGVTSPSLLTLLFSNSFCSLGLCPWIAVIFLEQVCYLLKATMDKSETSYLNAKNMGRFKNQCFWRHRFPQLLRVSQVQAFLFQSTRTEGIFFMWSDCFYDIKIFNSSFCFSDLLFQKLVLLKC